MLERGELLTMEEFFEVWTEWKNTKYHTRKHRGLSDAGEKWVTPIEMFENGPRYEKAAPPREYAAMLLMKAATARGARLLRQSESQHQVGHRRCHQALCVRHGRQEDL